MKKALVIGARGQDSWYLTRYLVGLDYEVWVTTHRDTSGVKYKEIPSHPVHMLYADLRDAESIDVAIHKSRPDEIYNLGAQVFVPQSWVRPWETFDVNVGGLARVLDSVARTVPRCRVYQASSSEMFGNQHGALDEFSSMNPVSPYGCSKLAAHRLVENYRDRGLFVVSGICFNHESPRRGPEMVTQKIASHVAQWKSGSRRELVLGNRQASRDWGFAGDFVVAMHKMLQLDEARDFVIGTGESYTVQDFVNAAVTHAGVVDMTVSESNELKRPNELWHLRANPWRANSYLGWKPTVSFEQLVGMMVDAAIARLKPIKENQHALALPAND